MSVRQLLPASENQAEILVLHSRFIGSAAPAFSVEDARSFIHKTRSTHPDASHHVPAFIIGHGASTIEHCSDDGEPAGTAGRPVLTVLKSSGLGDIVVVVTRYFGGTKLGTGGLVRAYTDAVKAVLANIPIAEKIATHTIKIAFPYTFYDRVKLMVPQFSGIILSEEFTADITQIIQLPTHQLDSLEHSLKEMSRGIIQPVLINTNLSTIFPTTRCF